MLRAPFACVPRVLGSLAGLLLAASSSVAADDNSANAMTHAQAVIDELSARLELTATVRAVIVPTNPLVVSVEPTGDQPNTFLLSFEERFLDRLDEEGLRAVVAHELGHVWIFTHHPYLQTESLANRVALRVVSRESLERVYDKVWERSGTKGTLARFLGQ